MRKIVLFLLALAMMTMLCCCIKDGAALGEKNSAETSDVATSANENATTVDADATGSGDKETTTSPLETGTTSPDPENDSNWTDNY